MRRPHAGDPLLAATQNEIGTRIRLPLASPALPLRPGISRPSSRRQRSGRRGARPGSHITRSVASLGPFELRYRRSRQRAGRPANRLPTTLKPLGTSALRSAHPPNQGPKVERLPAPDFGDVPAAGARISPEAISAPSWLALRSSTPQHQASFSGTCFRNAAAPSRRKPRQRAVGEARDLRGYANISATQVDRRLPFSQLA